MRALRAMHRDVWGGEAYDAAYAAGARKPPNERTRAAGFGAIGLGLLFVLFGIAPSAANATQPNPEHKVTLCHATNSYSNPYVRITPDVASILHHGHDGHDGPVFYPAIPKHTKWGDIIPPFDFGPGEKYAGKNWTPVGIAVFNDGCTIASPPTTTSTIPATTSSSAVTTSTIVVGGSTSSTSTPPTTTTGESTTTTSSSVPETTSTSDVTTTTVSSGTTAGETTTTTGAGATTTTLLSDTVATLAGPSTTVAAGNDKLPFTGGNSGAAVVAGLVLIAAGFGLTRRMPRQH